MTGVLNRWEARAIAALKGLLGLGLVAMVLVNVANAAGRYGGLPTLTGADELLVFGMIWIVMLGAILATRDRAHLAIDVLPARLAPRPRRVLAAAGSAVMALTCGFIAWHSHAFIERIGAIGQTSMGLGIPMVIPHFAVLTGFAGMAAVATLLTASDLAALHSGDGE